MPWLQLMSELSIILQIVKAAIQPLLSQVFHMGLVITFLVGNYHEEPVIYHMTVLLQTSIYWDFNNNYPSIYFYSIWLSFLDFLSQIHTLQK